MPFSMQGHTPYLRRDAEEAPKLQVCRQSGRAGLGIYQDLRRFAIACRTWPEHWSRSKERQRQLRQRAEEVAAVASHARQAVEEEVGCFTYHL